jgi:hypothetical protein
VQGAHEAEAHHLASTAKARVTHDLEGAAAGLRAVQSSLNKWQRELTDKGQEDGQANKVCVCCMGAWVDGMHGWKCAWVGYNVWVCAFMCAAGLYLVCVRVCLVWACVCLVEIQGGVWKLGRGYMVVYWGGF